MQANEVLPKHVEADTLPTEVKLVEAGLREGRVTDFDDWWVVAEVRHGEERERMVWEEAREFLASARPRNN